MTSAGYAHPEALVETDWLAAHLDDPDIRVVDGSYFLPAMKRDARQEYESAHIPGAVFFDIDAISDRSSSLPHMLPDADTFAAAVGALGIGNGHRVIVYDALGLMSAARVWWSFRVFGHDAVAVLNGGLPKWKAEGRPLTSVPTSLPAAAFTAQFRPELVAGIAEIRDRVASGSPAILDARAPERFAGTAEEVWPGRRRGHIPGSRNLPYTELLDPERKTLLPGDAIRAKFEAAGVCLSKQDGRPWVCSCGSGITAAALAFAAYLVGRTDAAVYDGSWAEWGLPGDTPVAP
jgi:thiosulfate/3-mercaptopyruvate sulfurtransferase